MEIKNIEKTGKQEIKKIIETQRNEIRDKEKKAQKIIEEVEKRGDKAVKEFTKKFDGVKIDKENLKVKKPEVKEAYEEIGEKEFQAIKKSAENIKEFHRDQLPKDLEIKEYSKGKKLGYKNTPIENTGCYVPGGKATYPSSVLMTAIPPKLAGVDDIIITTPPNKEGKIDPHTLVAADVAGITEIYKIGGVQAIAAMALGTETIGKRKKIVGPGGAYVAAAKNQVKKITEIDLVAGPSEIAILADKSSNPETIAWDLLAQAEHGPDSVSVLFTINKDLAKKVKTKLKEEIKKTKRKELIKKSLNRSKIFFGKKSNLIELINELAPEHLEFITKNPSRDLNKIKNAGAIFLGKYSPVAAGDYSTGCNHVLPTAASAKVLSGLGVNDFVKKTSIQFLNKKALNEIKDIAETMAEMENMEAHKQSIRKRLKEE